MKSEKGEQPRWSGLLRKGRQVFRPVYPAPFLGVRDLLCLALMLVEEPHQLVAADPDLIVPVLLGLVEDQLQAEMEMGFVNIVRILGPAIAGAAHIADHIPGLDRAAFL